MLHKTQGIVLNQTKYNDNSKIVTIFTRAFGKKSFIIYGLNSKKKRTKLINIYQPLFLLNLEFNYHENKSLQKIKEVSLKTPYVSIPFNIEKTAMVFFLTEILSKIIKVDVVDEELFDFISNSLQVLDLQNQNFTNYHLLFLVKITKYIGFEPNSNFSSQNKYFDISQGEFSGFCDEKYGMNEFESKIFFELINTELVDFHKIIISNITRSYLLQKILIYYTFYIENLMKLKSLKVLSEIFQK